MIALNWEGLRTTAIAAELGCHPQTGRERIARFNIEGVGGLGDRPGPGRKPRLTEAERGAIIALAGSGWRRFRREALRGQTFVDGDEIDHATRVATRQPNRRAKPWVWGRPPPAPRHDRRRFVYLL